MPRLRANDGSVTTLPQNRKKPVIFGRPRAEKLALRTLGHGAAAPIA
jgi:hypothetical protein